MFVYVPASLLVFGSGSGSFVEGIITSILASIGMFNALVYGGAYDKVAARFKAFRSSWDGSTMGTWISQSFRRRSPPKSKAPRNRKIPSEEPERYADFNGDDDAMLENQSSFFFKRDVVPNRDLEKDQVVVFGDEAKEDHSPDVQDEEVERIAVEAEEDDIMVTTQMDDVDDVESESAEE